MCVREGRDVGYENICGRNEEYRSKEGKGDESVVE